jgi:hypothetical protein
MPKTIGTRRETSLHRELKYSYAGQEGECEAEVGGFVADGINAAGEYFEVQIGSFGPLKQKAHTIASLGKLRIVYPIIVTKYIEVYDAKGRRQYRRKSPKKGNLWDLFDVLVYAPELPLIRNLSIELPLIDAVELRVQDGKGSWRRRGISIQDRRLLTLHECICLKKTADYLRFLPFTKNERITTTSLKEKAGISIALARKTLYVLCKMGLVEKTGKQGNSLVYAIKKRKKP